ncbi:helix-turn-helix domain-containing protein [Agrococcus sediminis]|uniref:Helix-turn-helix domain-containing protein n=1 Tax=Agrococcus sediminis TaxID=2599924 RepID=A0A5M8QJ07_9MICO|nr:helix-turn-helix domain-containing protein [Agrococcus sediminis]KAA6434930.1 helix-turn-helix domain-containing protein [Agrococcus sediminis]
MSAKDTPLRQPVYTPAEAPRHPLAMRYAITERQVRRAIQTNRIRYARPGGLRVLIAAEDLEAWITGDGSPLDGDRA